MVSNWFEPTKILSEKLLEPNSQLNDSLPEFDNKNLASKMMFQDIRSYLPDDILCKVDRASMGISLETRSPFLNSEVINFSTRLPLNMKIRDQQGKWVLRQILNKYVPQEIIDRPKAGFMIPIGKWLRGPLRDWAENLLDYKKICDQGFFNLK